MKVLLKMFHLNGHHARLSSLIHSHYMHVPIPNLEVRGYDMHYANIKQVVSSPTIPQIYLLKPAGHQPQLLIF